jgi:hypothetical protein
MVSHIIEPDTNFRKKSFSSRENRSHLKDFHWALPKMKIYECQNHLLGTVVSKDFSLELDPMSKKKGIFYSVTN